MKIIEPVPLLLGALGDVFAPAFEPGSTELWDPNGRCGLAQVSRDSVAQIDVEDTLLWTNESTHGTGAGGAAMAEAKAGVSFADRIEYALGVWAELSPPAGRSVTYQRATTQRFFAPSANIVTFLDQLVPAVGTVRVIELVGHAPLDPNTQVVGLVLVEDKTVTGPSQAKRTIHQLLPGAMSMPPDGAVTTTLAAVAEAGPVLRARLGSWAAGLVPGDHVRYQHCSCELRGGLTGFGVGDLLPPGQPPHPGFTGIVRE